MDRTQIILGLIVLIATLTMIAFALNETTPNMVSSVGWHAMCSVGWNG